MVKRWNSAVPGVVELAIRALIAVKPWAPTAFIAGSVMAIGMFVSTLSFMCTTPGVMAPEAGGSPALPLVGDFLVKDVVLLAVALWVLGDAVRTVRSEPLSRWRHAKPSALVEAVGCRLGVNRGARVRGTSGPQCQSNASPRWGYFSVRFSTVRSAVASITGEIAGLSQR
jgi:hypothetical protein